MEGILIAILQFLGEILLDFFFFFPFEFIKARGWFFSLGGAALGAISLWLRPEHIVAVVWLRTLNLLVTPFLLAYLIRWAELKFIPFKSAQEKDRTFSHAFLFFLCFALVRYFLAK